MKGLTLFNCTSNLIPINSPRTKSHLALRSQNEIFGDLTRFDALRGVPADYNFKTCPVEELSAIARQMISTIEGVGVAVPPSCRLWRYVNIFEAHNHLFRTAGIQTRADFLYQFADAYIELGMALPVVKFLVSRSMYHMRLLDLVRGAPTAALEKDPSHRNRFFECYVAAVFSTAGISVSLEEPDIMVDFDGHRLPIACKRVSSRPAYKRRLVEACEQVSQHKRRGVAFIEVSQPILNKDLPVIFSNSWTENKYLLPSALRKFAEDELRPVAKRTSQHLVGVFNVARMAVITGFLLDSRGNATLVADKTSIGAVPASMSIPLDEMYTADSAGFYTLSNAFGRGLALPGGDLGLAPDQSKHS